MTGPVLDRRTKVVATLGPATDPEGVLDALVDAGLDVARLNCSHGTHDDLRRRAAAVRAAAERAGRPLGLLLDLQGPKLRLAAGTAPRAVAAGEVVTFGGRGGVDVDVDFDVLAQLVTGASHLVIGDGVPRFAVERVEGDVVVARAVAPGPLAPRKGINVTYARPDLPAITPKDLLDLDLAAELGADVVALSFVRTAADMVQLRQELRGRGSHARAIAKIEKVEAFEDLDAVLAASDGVMVARGDLGIEAGAAAVPLMQKATIARATQAGKVVITATQMLESMIEAPEPTRAEATDVVNAVIDGTSAVMLSAETSVGAFPVQAVAAMAELVRAGEGAPEIHGRARPAPGSTSSAVLHAAVELADRLDAVALLIPTQSGGAPRDCAKHRPRRPIIALTHEPRVAGQLALEWGVLPIVMPAAESVDELIDQALVTARDAAGLPEGATVVLTAGRRTATPGATNLLMVREVPPA